MCLILLILNIKPNLNNLGLFNVIIEVDMTDALAFVIEFDR